MDWQALLRETSGLLGQVPTDLDSGAEGMEVAREGFPVISVERVPERNLAAISGLLCHYPDRERMLRLCEVLLNAHAFGMHTNNAFFAANSSLGQIIFHKMLPIDELNPETLRGEIENFIGALRIWIEAYENGVLLEPGNTSTDIPPALRGGAIRA
jgi:hypothetical protein